MEVRKEKDVVVLKPEEDDLADPQAMSRFLEQLLIDEGERRIVVDLSAVESIYSLQIGTLVTMHVLCYENVAVMKLANANEKLRSLLRMVGLEALMELHHGTKVAMESFGEAPAAEAAQRGPPSDPRLSR